MTRKIKQVNEWKSFFEEFHGASSVVNQNTGFQSLWKNGHEALDEIQIINQMNDYEFLNYCEILNNSF